MRAKYSEATLADLYDKLMMIADFRAAHKKNNCAVAFVYDFEDILDDDPAIVVALLKVHQSLSTTAEDFGKRNRR